MATIPMMTNRIEMTMATMGRLMKNFDIRSPPYLFPVSGDPGRVPVFTVAFEVTWGLISDLGPGSELKGLIGV